MYSRERKQAQKAHQHRKTTMKTTTTYTVTVNDGSAPRTGLTSAEAKEKIALVGFYGFVATMKKEVKPVVVAATAATEPNYEWHYRGQACWKIEARHNNNVLIHIIETGKELTVGQVNLEYAPVKG